MTAFVPASRLYDVESRTAIAHPAAQATDEEVRRAIENPAIQTDSGHSLGGIDPYRRRCFLPTDLPELRNIQATPISNKLTAPTAAASAKAPRTELIASNTGMGSDRGNENKRCGGGGLSKPPTSGTDRFGRSESDFSSRLFGSNACNVRAGTDRNNGDSR